MSDAIALDTLAHDIIGCTSDRQAARRGSRAGPEEGRVEVDFALSTQSKLNMGNDVNCFPIGVFYGKKLGGCTASSGPLFTIFRLEWEVNEYHTRGHMLLNVFKLVNQVEKL